MESAMSFLFGVILGMLLGPLVMLVGMAHEDNKSKTPRSPKEWRK